MICRVLNLSCIVNGFEVVSSEWIQIFVHLETRYILLNVICKTLNRALESFRIMKRYFLLSVEINILVQNCKYKQSLLLEWSKGAPRDFRGGVSIAYLYMWIFNETRISTMYKYKCRSIWPRPATVISRVLFILFYCTPFELRCL